MRAPDPYPLILELIENVVTADEPFTLPDGSFGSRIVPPPGHGWRVSDFRHDRRTKWTRRRSFTIEQPRRATKGGGGWRR